MMRKLCYQTFSTPLGKLTGIAGNTGLCVLTFSEEELWIEARLLKYYPGYSKSQNPNPAIQGIFDKTKVWLEGYFSGDFKNLAQKKPKIDLQGTPFALKAWQSLQKIPNGKIQSYGEMANKLGDDNAARAVGNAMRQNPIAILVPCHRVVGANGKLTGYRSGLNRKEWLLQHERALEIS